MNDFMYGLAVVKVGEKKLGYIEENSFKLNGAKGEVTKINAAQKHGGPVLVIPKSNGTIAPSFDLIQMDYENMAALMGGVVKKTAEKSDGLGSSIGPGADNESTDDTDGLVARDKHPEGFHLGIH